MGKPWISATLGALMLTGMGQAGASTLYATSVDAGVSALFTINPAADAFSTVLSSTEARDLSRRRRRCCPGAAT
jgi:hypothetical protein